MKNLAAGCCGIWLAITALGAPATEPAKKLIEFGWDEPDTRFMKEHIREMEQMPLDGCVFHAQFTRAGKRGDFTWDCWSTNRYTREEMQPAIDELKATDFKRFTHNFLRFNTAPGTIDWFDDFGAIVNNARVAAEVAREGKSKGILFDIEQYTFQLFNYRKQRDVATKSWDDYAAQVRKRGREVMQAFQEGYPDLTVFLTFGYTLPWVQSGSGKKELANCSYGLLAPFMDGLLEGAKGKTRVVDGFELAYAYKDPAQFDKAYAMMRTNVLAIVSHPEKYGSVFSAGFGLWMDNNWRKLGWSTNDFSTNYFSPAAFESSLRKALQTADDYVWIYTETPRWWSKAGTPEKLPEAYIEAVRRARER